MGVEAPEVPSPGNVPVRANSRAHEWKISVLALRALALTFIVIAISLMVTDKQTNSIAVNLPGMSTPFYLKKTATFSQIMGIKFYVGALSVVLAYLFCQIVAGFFCILTSGSVVGSKSRAWVTFILDQLMAYLLLSACIAATEVGYIAKHGETKVGWNQVCSDFGHFCFIYGFSLVNAFLAAFAFFPVVALSAFHLFRSPTSK